MAISNAKYDFIIIGQGLAGSILSYCLIQRGKNVLVIDNDHHASSSKVAAGIINPITGKKLNISDNFNAYYSNAVELYANMGKEINAEVFQTVPQKRLITDQAQHELVQKRLMQSKYQAYIAETNTKNRATKSGFSSVKILRSAIVNTKLLLTSTKAWLQQNSSFHTAVIDYQTISKAETYFTLDGLSAKKIIFCEGYQAINNPWLKDLPFKLAKGEIITINHASNKLDEMLNWGKWLVPSKDRQAKLGSNFVWNDLNLEPNASTQAELLESMQKHTSIKGIAIKSEVGIRPSTLRRDPFVGALSNLENSFCFNGFGSKGCLQIPYYAELLCDFLLDHKPLPNKVTKWL